MPRKTSRTTTTPIETVTHKDKRRNIPTEELRDFVADDEKQPKTVLYPRDPSLDPQLVWQGKDEQNLRNPWVPAINNHGGFGRWAFLEITDPWDAKNTIQAFIQGMPIGRILSPLQVIE